jgi:hypothetical protein
MVAYSFLMLHSSILGEDPPHQEEEAFSPLQSAQAHDAASDSQTGTLMWLLEDLVLWLVQTERIKTFRPRRN